MSFATVSVLFILVSVVVLLLALYLRQVLRSRQLYWLRRKIPFVAWPHVLYGNVRGLWSKEHSSTLLQRIYGELKERRLAAGGFNVFFSPSILVVDPELIEEVLVKNAAVFDSRGLAVDERGDPLSATLFSLSGQRWQEARDKLEPLFGAETTKRLFGTVASVANELRIEIRKGVEQKELDIQEWIFRYLTHVIGSSVFGIRCRTIRDPNTEFRAMGERAVRLDWMLLFKHWVGVVFPKVGKALGFKTVDPAVEKFYAGLCKATVLHRESYAVWKDDLLQEFIILRKRNQLSMDELTTQCYTFAKYGMETCSSVMVFCLYELANNPAIQERLRSEINHALEDTDGQLTYDVIASLVYLDQVVNETLRKYPPMDFIYRRSKADFDGIPVGTLFVVPIYALHHDPELFPSPEKFDPDRFAPDHRTKGHRYPRGFLPFGAGPRSCVGVRYASLVIKSGLVTLLRSYRFRGLSTCSAIDEIRFKPNSMVLSPVEGTLRLRVERL